MIRSDSASSVCGPKFIVPRQMRLTDRPVRPRCVYFIGGVSLGSVRGDESGGDGSPFGAGERGGISEQHLHTHVICACVVVRADALGDRVRIAPRDDGVDEAVGAGGGQVGVSEAEAAQVVRVVRQREVARVFSRAVERAELGSVSSTTICSVASNGPSPSVLRASAVCSGGTK